MSPATERRHRRGKAPVLVKVSAIKSFPYLKTRLSQPFNKAVTTAAASVHAIGQRFSQQSTSHHFENPSHNDEALSSPPALAQELHPSADYMEISESDLLVSLTAEQASNVQHGHPESPCEYEEPEVTTAAAVGSLQGLLWAGISRAMPTVEDAPDDDEEEDSSDYADVSPTDPLEDLIAETEDWGLEEDDDEYVAISAHDRLREHFLRQVHNRGVLLDLLFHTLSHNCILLTRTDYTPGRRPRASTFIRI